MIKRIFSFILIIIIQIVMVAGIIREVRDRDLLFGFLTIFATFNLSLVSMIMFFNKFEYYLFAWILSSAFTLWALDNIIIIPPLSPRRLTFVLPPITSARIILVLVLVMQIGAWYIAETVNSCKRKPSDDQVVS